MHDECQDMYSEHRPLHAEYTGDRERETKLKAIEKSKEIPIVLEAISSTERDTPEYLSVDYDKMKGTFLKGPKPDEVPYPVIMEPNLVIEYYSR